MRKEDISAAMNQMNSMSPEQMAAAAEAANSQNTHQVQYKFRASEQLKADGNNLFKAGRYAEASENYTRALSNLEGNGSPQAATLRRMCQVNSASCFLKLSRWAEAETMCCNVLQVEPQNAKALYRRGQARLQLGNTDGSVEDFREALDQNPGDDIISKALKDAEGVQMERKESAPKVTEIEDSDDAAPSTTATTETATAKTTVGGVTIEELSSAHEGASGSSQPKSAPAPPASATPSAPQSKPEAVPSMPMPMPSAATIDAQMAAMKKNPEMLKNMGAMMKDMTPEQLESIASMSGQGGLNGMKVDPSMMKMAGEMMSNMSPEELENMMKMQASMQQSFGTPSMAAGATATAKTDAGALPVDGTTAGGAGGMPMFDDMSPEMMSKMEEQMSDPKNMEAMTNMMQSMSPETLIAMSKQMGRDMSEEEASKTLEMMKGMKPDTVKRMMQAAKVMKQVTDGFKKATLVFMKREALLVAVFVLLLAVALHYFGIIG